MLRVGIDIGGTFTDISAIDEASGDVSHHKVLTTSRHPAEAVFEALDLGGIRLDQVSFLSHGTTLAINAVVERTGARTGIVTTEGFRDILELRRGARTHLADPLAEQPYCFVPGRWRVGVKERIAWDNAILEPLVEEDLKSKLEYLVKQGVESVAVCFLNSYTNPVHERRAGQILQSHFPGMYYTLSSDLVAEINEYERTSTAALNAYIHPVIHRYLSEMEGQFTERGLEVDLHLMQSNGGIITAAEAARHPMTILESGPAAGVIAAAYLGQLIDVGNLITFDMGGTTSKASVIEAGQPLTTVEFEIFEEPNKPGSGWPIRIPMIDIVEAGIGGGSIAGVDAGGIVQVGPESAGAEPGPVCYDRGGTDPTVTDANAVLGRLGGLVGGALPLNVEAAREAVDEKIARVVGLSVEEAAAGILEIADSKAADILRVLTISRGRDPRDFSLLAYGGAGPMEAAYIASQLGLSQAIVPLIPGTFSALGLLTSDLIHDAVRTNVTQLDKADLARVTSLYAEMESDLCEALRRQKVDETDTESVRILRTADIRYKGQFHMINVPVPPGPLSEQTLREVGEEFEKEHLRLYTFQSEGDPLELVNLRVRAIGEVPRTPAKRIKPGDAQSALKGTREVYFRETSGYLPCRVYDREQLGEGSTMEGPAIVEEPTSTTLVPPEFTATVDGYGNIFIRRIEP